jgi:hypothetical protein
MTSGSTPRTETGGPDRTPRSEIVSAVSSNREKEPAFVLDLSTSMDWSAEDQDNRAGDYPSPKSRRAIVLASLPLLVKALEGEDSQAAREQAGGDDTMGGVFTVGFASSPVEIGDLNSSNFTRVMKDVKWGGGTMVVPGIKMAIDDYDEEFGDRDAEDKPVHEILVITDGAASDFRDAERFLMKADAHRVYVVAIVGHGADAKRTYTEYKQVAEANQKADKFGKGHVSVVNFDGVTDPNEIAEDLITLVG